MTNSESTHHDADCRPTNSESTHRDTDCTRDDIVNNTTRSASCDLTQGILTMTSNIILTNVTIVNSSNDSSRDLMQLKTQSLKYDLNTLNIKPNQ